MLVTLTAICVPDLLLSVLHYNPVGCLPAKLFRTPLMNRIEAGQEHVEHQQLLRTVFDIDSDLRTRIVYVMRANQDFADPTRTGASTAGKTIIWRKNATAGTILGNAEQLREVDLGQDFDF